MKNITEKPSIFISYSWKNKNVVNKIDKFFQSQGFFLIRDERHLKYRQSIKEFMNKIRETDFVLMIISKNFLESENCMYEAMDLFRDENFEKRYLPIILKDTHIFKPEDRIEYINFWTNKYESLNNKCKDIKEINNLDTSLLDDLKHYENIKQNISAFLGKIKDKDAKTFQYHIKNDYKDIFEAIGFDDSEILAKSMKIYGISDKDEQQAELEKFLYQNPINRNALFLKAYIQSDLKNHNTALVYWENYIEIYFDDCAAWNNKGNNFKELKRYDEAIDCYDKAIEIKSDFFLAWYNKGILLNNLRRYEEAITCFDKVIKIKSDFHLVWYNKGCLLDDLGRFQESIECYEKTIEIKPDYYEAWYNIGLALVNLGKYNISIKYFEKTIEIKPNDYEAWNNKGSALGYLRKYDEAIECFDKAIKISPDYYEAWNNKGIVLINFENHKEAIKCFEKAIKLKPNYLEAWYNKGIAYDDLGNYNEAIKSFNKAIKINPNFSEAWRYKANIFGKLSKIDEVIKCYEHLIELKSYYIGAYLNLAEIYITINEFNNADIQINNALKYPLNNNNVSGTFFLKCINDVMLDKDINECYQKFEEICKKDFKTTWSFEEIENWVVKTDMNDDKREFIKKVISMLKEHL